MSDPDPFRFIAGQCWLSEAEPELGPGCVVQVEGRRVTLNFYASDATRVYAVDSAPLSRVNCQPGETVTSKDGIELVITRVQQRSGLNYYVGNPGHPQNGEEPASQELILPESELAQLPPRNVASEALLNGQFDSLARYELRAETMLRRQDSLGSPLRGLGGNRTALLPHQLYVAAEIGDRHAPRVLLADEVGLGKTVEAGLILQRQLQSGRISRILIVVPDNLQHQWLVEMLRRFNLRFALFDRQRFETSDWENPLLSEQLVIVSLDLLLEEPQFALHACEGEWDLLVVDEAHRLGGMEPQPGPGFSLVAALAGLIPAVLLLTATPEQLGQRAHFDRLCLLDPDRFHDFDRFQQETAHFGEIAGLFDRLQAGRWDQALLHALEQFDLIDDAEASRIAQQGQLNEQEASELESLRVTVRNRLLDRHGTGRLLFRNTRAAVGGFPRRSVHRIHLPLPGGYPDTEPFPEKALEHQAWWLQDPRVEWLIEFVTGDHQGKVLLLCGEDSTARQLHDYLRLHTELRSALFHAGMTLMQRDRAAAWFAEQNGAELMICSEIGSEGRNFQSARHLVLFDLPLNPELLEQRIGRIDRIGQGDHIELHLPLFQQGVQELLWRWCNEALDMLGSPSPAAATVYQKFAPRLQSACAGGIDDSLLEEALEFRLLEQELIERGRDRLLELNSCRPERAEQLRADLARRDEGDDLQEFLETLLVELGVEVEHHSARALILRPGAMMPEGALAELPDDGMTVTFSRAEALQREEMVFLRDDHSFVLSAMDRWLSGRRGVAAAAVLRNSGLKPGTLLLETLHLAQVGGGESHSDSINRYFPPTVIRRVSGVEQLAAKTERVEPDRARLIPFVQSRRAELEQLLNDGQQQAQRELEAYQSRAARAIDAELQERRARMVALRRQNPTVREEEIAAVDDQLVQLNRQLERASLQLEACCLLVVQN